MMMEIHFGLVLLEEEEKLYLVQEKSDLNFLEQYDCAICKRRCFLTFFYIPHCRLCSNYALNNTFSIKHGLLLPDINLLQVTCTQCFCPVLPKGRSA